MYRIKGRIRQVPNLIALSERLQESREVIGQWRGEVDPLACGGVGEAEFVGVEEVAGELGVFASVEGVSY